ncbi:MAG: ribosome silencing factor [Candidatus Eisenbacteria bacterium]
MTPRPPRSGDGLALAQDAVRLALEKKASDPVLLDLRELAAVSDYFVIVSAASEVQVKAIADHIEDSLREAKGLKPWHIEGREGRQWMLLDYIDVVVHVFHERTREYYLLERLWGDARKIEIADSRPA